MIELVGAIDLKSVAEGWHPARAHVLCCVFGCTVPIVDTPRATTYDRCTITTSKLRDTRFFWNYIIILLGEWTPS